MTDTRAVPGPADLSQRDLRILGAILQDYIASPEPVGSRALARNHGLDISPATVRNVMSDLEALGYLSKPHTSAGRVPTPKAFRLYVESFLRVRPLEQAEREQVDKGYDPPADEISSLMQQTGRILNKLTRQAAVVATPKLAQAVLQHISFVRLREDRVLAVLVTSSGVVQNRALTVDFQVSQDELDNMTRYLEELLGEVRGSLPEIRSRLAGELAEDRARYDRLASRAMELGRRALLELDEPRIQDVVVAGELSLLDAPEFADREKMRELLDSLSEKENLLRILERAEESPGIRIFIGADSELVGGEDVSLIVASYRGSGSILGTLGVIGPTRMDYARVIPYVEYTADLLAGIFEGRR
ncbi:MAG: heat-inducible transcriptional repressor HrcA, partial [Myxococcota bacterium]